MSGLPEDDDPRPGSVGAERDTPSNAGSRRQSSRGQRGERETQTNQGGSVVGGLVAFNCQRLLTSSDIVVGTRREQTRGHVHSYRQWWTVVMGRCAIQLVTGPAGSGKSTYCQIMQEHGLTLGRNRRRFHVVNLDRETLWSSSLPALAMRSHTKFFVDTLPVQLVS